MRTLLVGLDNPHAEDPGMALYPLPRGATGDRVCGLIAEVVDGYTIADYLRDFGRANLYPVGRAFAGRGATQVDRLMARWVLAYARAAGFQNLVIFGDRLLRAFDLERGSGWPKVHHLPHPSGRNTYYNDQRHRREAGELLAGLRERRHEDTADS